MESGGELPRRGGLEHQPKGHLETQHFRQAGGQLGRDERVTSEPEEVVVWLDLRRAEELGHDGRHLSHQLGGGFAGCIARLGDAAQDSELPGQPALAAQPALDFPARGPGTPPGATSTTSCAESPNPEAMPSRMAPAISGAAATSVAMIS